MYHTVVPMASALDGASTRIVSLIVSIAVIAVAWTGFKLLAKASNAGDVKSNMGVLANVVIGLLCFVIALSLAGVVAFLNGVFGSVIH
jgi:Zn-dependent protease